MTTLVGALLLTPGFAYGQIASRATVSAYNGRGPWWNAGASHMNQAVPTSMLRRMGLVSLLDEHRRLACYL